MLSATNVSAFAKTNVLYSLQLLYRTCNTAADRCSTHTLYRTEHTTWSHANCLSYYVINVCVNHFPADISPECIIEWTQRTMPPDTNRYARNSISRTTDALHNNRLNHVLVEDTVHEIIVDLS